MRAARSPFRSPDRGSAFQARSRQVTPVSAPVPSGDFCRKPSLALGTFAGPGQPARGLLQGLPLGAETFAGLLRLAQGHFGDSTTRAGTFAGCRHRAAV